MAIQLLVVDDHQVARIGIRQMVTAHGIQVAGEAATAEEALQQIRDGSFDAVLLDVRLPGADGLRCLAEIRKLQPELPVLMFSAYAMPSYLARALTLGANGYLTKDQSAAEIVKAIHAVAGGKSIWSPETVRSVTGPIGHPDTELDMEVPLTARELEVLKQLAFGLTNKEIAQALSISNETVKEHVQHILRKLSVADRTQAAVWAVRRGLA